MLPSAANTDSRLVDPQRLLASARLAEAAGFDSVEVGDHLLHPYPLLKSLTTLAAVAAVTTKVTIGTCVLLAALRSAEWLAKQLGTIDAFAPGRLRIGIGLSGEYPAEFELARVPLSERGRRTEEIVRELRRWFSPDQGVWGSSEIPMVLAPVPQKAPPILFAGWKDVALRRAARLADGWIGYLLSPESFARRRSFLLDHGAGTRGAFTTGMLLPVHLDLNAAHAATRAAAAWTKVTGNGANFPERLFVAGPPDEVIARISAYRNAGCTEVILSLVDQGETFHGQLEILVTDVIPQLRRL